MNTLAALLREAVGLVVDDGSLALGALLVVAVSAGLRYGLQTSASTVATFLALGLAAMLVENVLRTVRRRRTNRI